MPLLIPVNIKVEERTLIFRIMIEADLNNNTHYKKIIVIISVSQELICRISLMILSFLIFLCPYSATRSAPVIIATDPLRLQRNVHVFQRTLPR